MNITSYQSVTIPQGARISIEDVIRLIRSDPDQKVTDTITKIRSCNPEAEKGKIDELKKLLPGFSFGGLFPVRGNNKFIEASGLMTLDFDGPEPAPKELDKYAFLRFKSPQAGVREKIIVRIPIVKDAAEYRAYYMGMADYIFDLTKPKGIASMTSEQKEKFRKTFKPILDMNGKDISRFCFRSLDPDALYNPDSILWDTKQETKVKDPKTNQFKEQAATSNHRIIRRVTDMILKGSKGNRHDTCRDAGFVAGGYIAGGDLNEQEMELMARGPIAEINDAEEAGFKDDYRAFLWGMQTGKQYPLNDVHVKNIQEKINRVVPDFIEDQKDEVILDEIDRIRKEGYSRGVSTGWDELDQYYSILPGTSTVVYAAPHVGKTIFVFNMMINIALKEKWKGIIFSPETGSTADIYLILIEMVMGKDARAAGDEEYKKAKAWVLDNFYVLNPDKDRFIPSVEDLLSMAEKIIAEDKKVKMLFIDTIGDTNVDFADERTDKSYIKMMIGLRQWFVNYKTHVFLSSHIISAKPAGVDADNGHQIFSIPHESQIKGGQALSQKGFSIIALYQYYPATQEPDPTKEFIYKKTSYYRNSMYAIVQKVKPHYVGRRGSVHLLIDRDQHRLIEFNNPEKKMYVARDFTVSAAAVQQELDLEDKYNNEEPEWIKS